MKKVLFIVFCILLGITLATLLFPKTNIYIAKQHLPTPTLTPATKILAPPQLIEIPKLNINAYVESVGIDDEGRMDIPKNYLHAAWYKLGPKPGEKGSAVIDGHVDTPQGTPSVFANIQKLVRGDTIIITASDRTMYKYYVENVTGYPLSTIPLNKIFDKKINEKRLNLITCSGIWDPISKNYSRRIVVYSKME